jgi:hypothetical protein
MRSLMPVLAAVALTGCLAPAIQSHSTENEAINVELLFTHDGCRVYRFRDGSAPIYYTDCRASAAQDSATSTGWRVSCGRGCTRFVSVSTAMNTP